MYYFLVLSASASLLSRSSERTMSAAFMSQKRIERDFSTRAWMHRRRYCCCAKAVKCVCLELTSSGYIRWQTDKNGCFAMGPLLIRLCWFQRMMRGQWFIVFMKSLCLYWPKPPSSFRGVYAYHCEWRKQRGVCAWNVTLPLAVVWREHWCPMQKKRCEVTL